MVDAYEMKHGIVDDRSVFDGEYVVPQHMRNSFALPRMHGGLLSSLSRSRTFLSIPNNHRNGIHSSVPDLSTSRNSMPNTPTNASAAKRMNFFNNSSVESVVEESAAINGDDGCVETITTLPRVRHHHNNDEMRRNSEQLYRKPALTTTTTTAASPLRTTTPPSGRIFPFRVGLKKSILQKNNSSDTLLSPNNLPKPRNNGVSGSSAKQMDVLSTNLSHSMQNIHSAAAVESTTAVSKWGSSRISGSFSSDLNVISKYTIPRPSLGGDRQIIEASTDINSTAVTAQKQQPRLFLSKENFNDSAA